jgi:hypothetical protein
MSDKPKQSREAAIVCSHVAVNGLPILQAIRDEPTMPEDSGWQFLCEKEDHENADAPKVWLICEVLDYEPSLANFVELPPGSIVTRKTATSDWEVGARS